MIIPNTRLTPALEQWLRDAGDGGRPLSVGQVRSGSAIHVVRWDGSGLSESEEIEIKSIIAAHAAEPLKEKNE